MKKMRFTTTISVCLLLLQHFTYCTGNIPHINTESTEVLVEIYIRPDASRHQLKRSTGQIPDEINADLNVDGANINLHLQKNPDISDDVPVFLRRQGTVHRYAFPAREVMAAYQDIIYEASFLIWDKSQDGAEDSTQDHQNFHMLIDVLADLGLHHPRRDHRMGGAGKGLNERKSRGSIEFSETIGGIPHAQFGTLLVHNKTYLVQPPHLSGVNYHTIARMQSQIPTQTDYIQLPEYDQGALEQTSDSNETFNRSRRKRQTISYEVEVLIVVDYSVYNFWYAQTPGSGSSRHSSAVNSIKQFYSFVMNAMNLRYQTVTGRGFTIVCLYSGIYIADTPSSAPFVENNIYATGSGSARTQIVASDVLPAFRSWANTNLNPQVSYDHAMMFSAYDFITISGSQISTGTAGLAYLGGLCSDARYSINEDHFTAGLVTVATHELGHNLGARHDGDGNGCSSNDGFIMSASAFTSLDNPPYNAGQWIFSTCSLSYFESFANFLNNGNQNCMLLRSPGYDATAQAEYSEDIAGQVYSPDYQCEQGVGPGSYLYRSYYEDDYTTICQVLACSLTNNDGSFTSKLTWEGTSCGNNRLCRASNCVSSASAPSGISDSCVFGDIPYNIPGESQTCSEFLSDPSTSYHCYQTFYRRSCCATCDMHKQNNAGIADCEYGDKADFCSSINTRDCYSNDQACCKTCADTASRNPDCKYGDRVTGCLSLLCPVYNLITRTQLCCGTCGGPTTTSTSTLPTQTTTTTAGTSTLTSSRALTGSEILRPILTTLFGTFRTDPVTTPTTAVQTPTVIPTTIPLNITSSLATLTATGTTASNTQTNSNTPTIIPTTIPTNITSSLATLTATQTTNSNTQSLIPTTIARNTTSSVATLTATQTKNSNTQTIIPTTIPRNITSSIATLTASQATSSNTQTIVPTTIPRNITSSIATLTASQTTNSKAQTIVPTTIPRNITSSVATLTATQTTESNTQTIVPTTFQRNITSSIATLTATQTTKSNSQTIIPTTVQRNLTSSVATLTATQTTDSNTQTIIPTTIPRKITSSVATLTATQTTNLNTPTIIPTTIPRNVTSSVASLTATQPTSSNTQTVIPTTIPRNMTSSVATLTATQRSTSEAQTIFPTISKNITSSIATQITNSNTQTIIPTTIRRNLTSSLAPLTATQTTNSNTQTIIPTTILRNITSSIATLTATKTTNSNTQTVIPTTITRNVTSSIATLTATLTTNSNIATLFPTTVLRNVTSSLATLIATQTTNSNTQTIIPTTIQKNVTPSIATLTATQTTSTNTTTKIIPTSISRNVTSSIATLTATAITQTNRSTASNTNQSQSTASAPKTTKTETTTSTPTSSQSHRSSPVPTTTSMLTTTSSSTTSAAPSTTSSTSPTMTQTTSSMSRVTTLSATQGVKILLIFPLVITDVNFDDTASDSYTTLLQTVLTQLRNLYLSLLGNRFRSITIIRLRPGTLIVEYEVEFDNDPAVTSDLTDVNVNLVNGEMTITIANQTESATFIEIGNATATKSTIQENVCELFNAAGGCNNGDRCSIVNEKATCGSDDLTGFRRVNITLIFPIRITNVDFDDISNPGYQNLLQSVLIQLRVLYLEMLGDLFKGIRMIKLRPGTFTVEYEVEIVDDPTVTADLTHVNVKIVTGEKNITITNEIISAILIQIDNVTASGGCYAGHQCSIKDGKAACDSDDNALGARSVRIMLVLPITIPDVNFNEPASAGYINLLQIILNQLRIIYLEMLGQRFRDIAIISLRPGTLIIEYDVEFEDDPTVSADLTDALIKLLIGERTITISNQEAFASLIEMNNVTVTRATVQDLICELFNAAGGCSVGKTCVVQNGRPACELGKTTVDTRNVGIRLIYPVISNDVDFDNTSSASYQNLLQSILIQLRIIYMDILGNRFKGITSISMRPGTLIVDYEVEIDDDAAVTTDLTDVNVKLVTGDKTISVSNQIASADMIEIGNVTATKATIMDNICALFTASGGCLSGFHCFVRDGKASCKEEEDISNTRTVRIMLVLPVIITDVNFDDPNSDGYIALLQTILTQLRVIYMEILGKRLRSITMISLRPGTLIVEYDVEFEDDPTVTSDLTDVNLKLVTGEKRLIISNQAVSPDSVEVANATATKATASSNVCAMFDASGGCKPGYHCVVVDGKAACKADAETRTRLALVLALAIGLPLLFILLAIFICLVLRAKRMKKLEKMSESASSIYSDRMEQDGVKQVFPSVIPYGPSSNWNDNLYMARYPQYYNIVPFAGKMTIPRTDGLQTYAYDNRATDLDSMVAYTYVKPSYANA